MTPEDRFEQALKEAQQAEEAAPGERPSIGLLGTILVLLSLVVLIPLFGTVLAAFVLMLWPALLVVLAIYLWARRR